MGTYIFAVQMSIIMAASHVTPFTISGRQDGDPDLANTIAVLHRHRRRSTDGYLNPGYLLRGGTVSVDDIRNWLKASNIGDESSDLNPYTFLNSNLHFKDLAHLLRHGDLHEKNPLIFSAVEPSRQEMEEIFDSSDQGGSNLVPDWFVESKMADGKGVNKYAEKKSNSPVVMTAAADEDDNLSLNSLTKDEFRALTKAITKLRKQSGKFDEKIIQTQDSKVGFKEIVDNFQEPQSGAIVQAVNDDEVKFTHEGVDSPVVTETEMVAEHTPDVNEVLGKEVSSKLMTEEGVGARKSEKYVVNELVSALQDNTEEDTDTDITEEIKQSLKDINSNRINGGSVKEWEIEKHEIKNPPVKRNSKRSVAVLPGFIKDLFDDDDDTPPGVEKFVARVLKLQDEVDRLMLISQLEGLENDVLTDALNEASLGQDEETVSGLEFESLKEAVRIEEALKDLRTSRNSKHHPAGVIKMGQSWRRKRGLRFGGETSLDITDPFISHTSPSLLPRGHRATKEDMRRLLGQTYLMKDQETGES